MNPLVTPLFIEECVLFIIQENTKAPHYWPVVPAADGFLEQRASNAEVLWDALTKVQHFIRSLNDKFIKSHSYVIDSKYDVMLISQTVCIFCKGKCTIFDIYLTLYSVPRFTLKICGLTLSQYGMQCLGSDDDVKRSRQQHYKKLASQQRKSSEK